MFHTIACAFSKVIFWMEIHLPLKYAAQYTAVNREFDDHVFPMTPKTCALLLRATKPIWNSQRLVIMDAAFSGIAVLVGLIMVHLILFAILEHTQILYIICNRGICFRRDYMVLRL